MTLQPLTEAWNLELQGLPLGIVTFIRNMNTVNALLTGNWATLWDAIKHLILPATALGTIPLAIIARNDPVQFARRPGSGLHPYRTAPRAA